MFFFYVRFSDQWMFYNSLKDGMHMKVRCLKWSDQDKGRSLLYSTRSVGPKLRYSYICYNFINLPGQLDEILLRSIFKVLSTLSKCTIPYSGMTKLQEVPKWARNMHIKIYDANKIYVHITYQASKWFLNFLWLLYLYFCISAYWFLPVQFIQTSFFKNKKNVAH